MSDSILHYNTNEFKSIVFQRLANVSVKTDNIAIPLKEGTKSAYKDFKQKSNRRDLEQNLGNYAILAKGRLHFIDIDEPDKAPNALLKNTQDTFSVSTPSEDGEHRYVVSDTPLPNIDEDWGEIRSQNQYVVGPGSSIPDYGSYTIENDAPIQSIAKDELEDWIGGFDKETVEGYSEDIDLESLSDGSDRLTTAHDVLSKLQSDHTAFFQDLHGRLNGGRGSMGHSLNKEDSNEIDTSRLDFVTLGHLYGVFRFYGKSHSESRRLAGAVYGHYSNKTPYTKDGQMRKWQRRGKNYQHGMLDNAIRQYDESKILRLLNQSNGSRRDFNDYGQVTYKISDFVIDWLTNDWSIEEAQEIAAIGYQLDFDKDELESVSKHPMYQDTTPLSMGGYDCKYPSSKAVRVICSEIDGRSEKTYKTTIQRLQRDGFLKVAHLDGNDWRVYHSHKEDPSNFEKIRHNGEKLC